MLQPLGKICTALIFTALTTLTFNTQTYAGDEMHPHVRLKTNFGEILLELDRAKAPKSVENFISYVSSGFYDGTVFHRVIDGFMVQGGGFTQDYKQKSTKANVDNEADNGLKNMRGTIALARTSMPHSATSQFFINVVDNDFLNHRSPTQDGWGYAVFGKVTQGLDIVDKIRKVPTGSGGQFPKDVPQDPVVIIKATLEP